MFKPKPIAQQVIVITGASSGIGLATAQLAAKKGAKLVIASRSEEALRDIAQELKAKGSDAIYVVADVADESQVQHIADEAIGRFGGFDTWVNNAGTGIWGKLEAVGGKDSRRLFDTNYWGVVYGSLIAVKHFKQKGGGSLINLGSVASDAVFPLQAMYCASKHAIKAFTNGLRMELMHEDAPVAVTLIKPAAIGTPFAAHAGNYTGKVPKLPSPLYAPEEVAMAIVSAAQHPHRDIYIGGGGKIISNMGRFFPLLMDKMSGFMFKAQVRAESAVKNSGSLHNGGSHGKVRGNHPGQFIQPSLYTRAVLHPKLTAALLASAGALAAFWHMKRTQDKRY